MTLQHCRYIVKIAECRSFNEAARELFVTQSNLSMAIKTIEEEFGIAIFLRNNRGIELTEEGTELLEYARRIVLQMDEIDKRFNDEKNSKRKLTIETTHSTMATKASIELYKQMDDDSFTINILESDTKNIISDVESGKCDVGILSVNSSNEKAIKRVFKEKSLIFVPLSATKLYMCCNDAHPLAKKETLELKDLMPYPNISYYDKKEPVYNFTDKTLDEFNPPKKISVTSSTTLMTVLKETDAVMLDGKHNVEGIACVPLENDVVYTSGYLLKENTIPSELAKKYIEILNSLKKLK